MLEVRNLSFSYGRSEVLSELDFSVNKGEFVSVLGPNGVGKSTLFKCILGTLPGYSGDILIEGKNTREMSGRELSGYIAYIPQIHRPTFGYSVLDTVLMGLTRQLSPFAGPKAEHREKAEAALERFGIEKLRDRNFATLSGGEQQLVLAARAVAQEAEILIMDEPTSALDFGNQYRVLEQIRRLTGDGYTVLLSTHNPQHAMSFADRILALSAGRIAAFGAPEDIFDSELVKRLYGIEAEFADTGSGRIMIPKISGRRAEG